MVLGKCNLAGEGSNTLTYPLSSQLYFLYNILEHFPTNSSLYKHKSSSSIRRIPPLPLELIPDSQGKNLFVPQLCAIFPLLALTFSSP